MLCGKALGRMQSKPRETKTDNAAFQRVIGYFLDHEKPKAGPKPKRKPAHKKPSTKAKKRA
jgi:hypothetical protein